MSRTRNAKCGQAACCALRLEFIFIPSKGTDDEEAVGGQLCVSMIMMEAHESRRVVIIVINGNTSVT